MGYNCQSHFNYRSHPHYGARAIALPIDGFTAFFNHHTTLAKFVTVAWAIEQKLEEQAIEFKDKLLLSLKQAFTEGKKKEEKDIAALTAKRAIALENVVDDSEEESELEETVYLIDGSEPALQMG